MPSGSIQSHQEQERQQAGVQESGSHRSRDSDLDDAGGGIVARIVHDHQTDIVGPRWQPASIEYAQHTAHNRLFTTRKPVPLIGVGS